MYIQLGNPKHTPILLEGASTRLSFLSYNQGPKWPDHPGEPTLWGSPRKSATGFPLISFYHGHSPVPKIATRMARESERFAHLSCKTVLSFTVNCNSSPCYVFGTFKLATSLLTNGPWPTQVGQELAPMTSTPCLTKALLPSWSPIFIQPPSIIGQ